MSKNRISNRDLPFLIEYEKLTLSHRYRRSPGELLDWLTASILITDFGLTQLNLDLPPEEHADEIESLKTSYFKTLEQCPPSKDLLGIAQQFAESVGHRQQKGAFYTPEGVSYMMAQMQLHDLDWNEHPVLTIADPTAGSGSMILSVIRVLAEEYPLYLDRVSVTAADLDRRACLCAATQILSVCAVNEFQLGEIKVLWMDSLRNDLKGVIVHGRNPKYGLPTYDMQTIADLPNLVVAA